MTHKYISAAVIAGIVGTTALASLGVVHAASTTNNSQSQTSTVSTNTRHRHKHHAKRQQIISIRINQAVRDGTITKAQAQSFRSELKSLRQQHKTAINKSSTKAERQTERTTLNTELKSWASTNNFPLSKIFPKL